MLNKLFKSYIYKFKKILIEKEDSQKIILGKQLCFLQKNIKPKHLQDIEFKVFSQWGEDGIIQYLINSIPIENKFFIEFGVEDYNESNTRFLMMNNNWSGLVIDGSKQNIDYIKSRDYFWKFELTAIHSFITKDNINSLLKRHLKELDIKDNIGLLSIDIDGVDYWVLNEINCITPQIIICEYNAILGNNIPLTITYEQEFVREKSHYSCLYFGANLKAFEELLNRKGYVYIGSNLQNSNAFFIKENLAKKYLSEMLSHNILFETSKIRESRDKNGNLSFLKSKERINTIKNMDVINLSTNQKTKISEILNEI